MKVRRQGMAVTGGGWFGRLRAVAAGVAIASAPGAAAQESQASVFGGIHYSNVWEDLFTAPRDLDWRDAGLVGLAYGRDWPTAHAALTVGVEVQAVAQFGEQEHLEFNLPGFLRYQPGPAVPVRSIAFGIGLSHATEVPDLEVAIDGGSRRTLLYWALEVEFGPRDAPRSVFTRLHHRSNAYGLFADKGGSNALVLGLRRRW